MNRIRAIAVTTSRELVRSKVLYSFLFFAAVMLIISTVFSTTTIGDQIKLLKDFGLANLSIFTVVFVVIAGSTLLAKELGRKTIFNILAKPVERYEFLVGKFLGISITASAMVILMGSVLSIFMYFMEGQIDWILIHSYLFLILELFIISAATIFFSSIVVTPILSGMFAFGTFLAGRSGEYLTAFASDHEMPPLLREIASILRWILPQLDRIYVANDVVYGTPLSLSFTGWSILYVIGYCGILLTISTVIWKRRSFN